MRSGKSPLDAQASRPGNSRPTRPWTEHEDELIRRLRLSGALLPAIAAELGHRTPDAVARRIQLIMKKGVRKPSTRHAAAGLRNAPPWTEHEDELICRLRLSGAPLPAIAAELHHRTPDAVARRIQNLIKRGAVPRRRVVDPTRKRWTKREDGLLRKMRARGATLSDIAVKLDRTFNAVARRAHDLIALGAVERCGSERRPKSWSAEEDRLLDDLRNEGKTMQEVALLLGRTRDSVNHRVADLLRQGRLKLLHHDKPRGGGLARNVRHVP